MSDWRLSANSTIYKEALKATETIQPPATGFVRPQDITGRATETQFKQNNTIIQLLLKLTEEVEDLKVAVKRLETVKGKEVTQPDDLSDSLDQIQQQLQKLSLDGMSRTQTTTEEARPSVSERDTNRTPTVEDQIRGYRLGSRLRFEAQRRLPGQSRRYQRSLESQMNPDAELSISQYRRAQQVQAETLYQAGWTKNRHRVYQHYSDERTLVTDGQQVELPFISEESFNRLLQEGLQHLHIGLIMVRLYTLHRRSAGVNALVLIRDTRWRDDRAVISSMEMDFTSGTQLAYTAPDMTLSIRDFRDHIQLVIQTHGYEGWQGGESNLLLSRSLIGRLSNTSHTNFRYNVQNVADHLASRGVRAIPSSQRTTAELQGRQWLVRPAIISQIQNPQAARIRARTDGSLSVRFSGYTTTIPEQEVIRGENDEEIEQKYVNLLTDNEDWYDEDWYDNDDGNWLGQGWPHYLDPEFSDPEEFSEADSEELGNDDSLFGSWFLAILGAEQAESTIEMLEPINPYQWFAVEQMDSEDELVQMTFAEFNWLETIEAEAEWSKEQALMMTCQWDESEDETEDDLLSTVQFLSQLDAPADQDEDLISLWSKGGGNDASSQKNENTAEIKWDEYPSEAIYMIEEMEYPQFKNLKEKVETVLSLAESSLTRIPPEPIMGPAMYPPGSRQPQNLQVPEIRARLDNIRGGYARQMNERFNLPTAQASQGAILVLPEDIGLYSEVISRWESITLNLINERNWADNKSKVNYIENLLGETEKKTWIQWRMAYPTEYEELVNIADDPQNVISQIRRMFLLEDPTTGSTEEQDRAYNDLERLSCHNVKDLFDYINDYKILAAKSGRMFISPELSTKFFRKMPHIIGGEIEKAFAEKYPGNTVGVIPRIHFTYQYLSEQCKRVALQRSLKDLSFCSRIPVPGYYQKNKKYGFRKAKTYRGKPHDTHIRVFKRKHADKIRKCKCFICGEEGHFARNCTRQKGNIARAAIVENLDLDDDWDVLSVDQNEPDSDTICSFSEGEGGTSYSLMAGIGEMPYETAMMMTNEEVSWRVAVSLPQEVKNCAHQWEDNGPVAQEFMRCMFCKEQTNPRMRAHCSPCHLTVCPMCSRFNLGRKIIIQRSKPQYDSNDTLINELIGYTNFLLAENQRLKAMIEELEMGNDLDKMRDPTKGKAPEKPILEEMDSDDETIENHIQKQKGVIIKMMTEEKEYISTQVPDPRKGRRVLNRL
ncbi:hypothetical protein LUZ63_013417 [Rhynchospora breviuscula]|uniref:CCHC-type domain-containing protein n=1 Tax=Rhynchospora breviuscula TaxID=2022672 RepID=A0A9Q0HK59_9POAL|nr:hypothetical protein LUZ63_013417 [Rhynchospora breviuscula]